MGKKQKIEKYLRDYYNNPRTEDRLTALLRDQVFAPDGMEEFRLISNELTGNVFPKDQASGLRDVAKQHLKNAVRNVSSVYDVQDPLYERNNPGVKGYAKYNSNGVWLSSANYDKNRELNPSGEDTYTHEISHISNMDTVNQELFKDMWPNSKYQDLSEYEKYLFDNPEIYPRVMEMRRISGMDLNKTIPSITDEQFEKAKNSRAYKELSGTNKVPDSNIRYWMDIMVDNATQEKSNDGLNITRNGGMIRSKKNKMFAGGEILGMAKGLAGNTSLYGAAGSVAKGLIIDPNKEDNSLGAQLAGNALEMAGKGAQFGPWGAAVGGAIGLAKGFMADKQEDKQIEANFNNAIQMRNAKFENGGQMTDPKKDNWFFQGMGTAPGTEIYYDVDAGKRKTIYPDKSEVIDDISKWDLPGIRANVAKATQDQTMQAEINARNRQRSDSLNQAKIAESNQAQQELIQRGAAPKYVPPTQTRSQAEVKAEQDRLLGERMRKYQMEQDSIANANKPTGRRKRADGGMLNSFDGGYTHDDPAMGNIYEGIPIGPESVVEKGEMSEQLEDGNLFIYSDKNKFDKKTVEALSLPKKAINKTPAQLAEMFDKMLIDNPNDPYIQKSTKMMLDRVKEGNNVLKSMVEAKGTQMAEGGVLPVGAPKKPESNVPLGTLQNSDPIFEEMNQIKMSQTLPSGRTADSYFQRSPLERVYNREADTVTNTITPEIPTNSEIKLTKDVYNKAGIITGVSPNSPDKSLIMGKFNKPTVDPVTIDAMRAAGFYGSPTDVKFDATVQPDKLGYIGSEKRDTGNYSISANKFADYNEEYMPWFEKNYGGGKNTAQMMGWFDPNSIEWQSLTPEQQAKAYQNLGELRRKGYDTKDPNVVRSLLTDGKPGPATSLINYQDVGTMTPREVDIPTAPPDAKLTIKPTAPGIPEEPPTDTPPNRPNLWPEAGLLTGIPAMFAKPKLETPSTMSIGNIQAPRYDTMTGQSLVNASSRGAIGAASQTGSMAQLMGNLQGINSGTGKGIADVYSQAQQQDNAMQMQADMFNVGNQANAASQNQQAINSANARNTAAQNQFEMEKFDTITGTLQDYVANAYNRRLHKDELSGVIEANRYNPYSGEYSPGDTKSKSKDANGGVLRTKRSCLK